MQQLPLKVELRVDATFTSFLSNTQNTQALQALQLLPADDYKLVFLHGPTGSGKSHLLQAACHHSRLGDLEAVYLPLDELAAYPPQEVLTGLEAMPLVALDNLAAIAGSPWEEALFNLLNRKMLLGGTVIVANSTPASDSGLVLPDLVSRLAQGLVFALAPPDDEFKARLLVWRAAKRGMEMHADAANYVLNHYSRDIAQLMKLLDQLDTYSLSRQRKLTLPLVRELITRGAQ